MDREESKGVKKVDRGSAFLALHERAVKSRRQKKKKNFGIEAKAHVVFSRYICCAVSGGDAKFHGLGKTYIR